MLLEERICRLQKNEEKKDKRVYFYSVTYNKDKLKEILEKLKNYSYISISQEQIGGNITKWPATKKKIQKPKK